MTSREINTLLQDLSALCNALEWAFVEGGGEVTEETASYEEAIKDVKELLMNDGVDSLGRWLKTKQDERVTLEEEKAKIDRMMKANDRTVEHILSTIDAVMNACGMDQAKGMLYSFKRSTSTTHTANTDLIDQRYAEKVSEAAKAAGLPAWLRVKISPSYKLVPEGVETDEFITTITPTIRFNKPKKIKKDESE